MECEPQWLEVTKFQANRVEAPFSLAVYQVSTLSIVYVSYLQVMCYCYTSI